MTRDEYRVNIEKIVAGECKKGEHIFEKIYESGSDMESTVIRWCAMCGSVVIDTDFDGRTQPGAVMTIRSPAITKVLS